MDWFKHPIAAVLVLAMLAVDATAKSTGRPRRRPVDAVIGRDGGVEAGGVDPFPDVQLLALRRLIGEIRGRHPAITLDRVLRHSDVDRSTFPAARHGQACAAFRRKRDPGEAFPWDAFTASLARD